MDYFFICQKSTSNLENNKCICQGNIFVYHVTGPRPVDLRSRNLLQNYILSYVHLKNIYKTLKGIGKVQFVSGDKRKLTLVWYILLILLFTVFEEQCLTLTFCKLSGKVTF